MRKATSEGDDAPKEGRARRYWVRAGHPASAKGSTDGASKRASKARFLEPYRLADERRAELIDTLTAAGLGDAESRALFATAVEYDIAGFRQAGAEPVPAAAPVSLPELAALAGAVETLAERIAALAPAERALLAQTLEASDPLRRGYGGAYLDALSLELRRLAGAASASASGPAATVAGAPPPSESARRFVRRVARVYEECLESRPVVEPGGPFLAVLRLLAPEAGVGLPADAGCLVPILAEP